MINSFIVFGLCSTTAVDLIQARWLLGELTELQSYQSFAYEQEVELRSCVFSDNFIQASKEIGEQYRRLTKVSPKAFYLAYQAAELKAYWEVDDPEWREYLGKPEAIFGVEALVPFVDSRLTGFIHPQFSTLYWLMFDDAAQKGRSPWKLEGNEILLVPNTLPISGMSVNHASIPELDILVKLKKREFLTQP